MNCENELKLICINEYVSRETIHGLSIFLQARHVSWIYTNFFRKEFIFGSGHLILHLFRMRNRKAKAELLNGRA